MVNCVVTELIRTGRVAKPALGVVLLRESDTRALEVPKGVMLAEVRPNSAAAKAGLLGFRADPAGGEQLIGEVILSVNGEATSKAWSNLVVPWLFADSSGQSR